MKSDVSLRGHLGYLTWVGMITIFLFFGVLGGWMSLAPLSQGTLATGSVSPDGYRRTVQHLEGGIIQALNVKEGDHVLKGDVLVTLHSVRARSDQSISMDQLLSSIAEKDRLIAEIKDQDKIVVDDRFNTYSGRAGLAEVLEIQQSIFDVRRSAMANQYSILDQRIRQLEQNINGVKQQNISLDSQYVLIDEEISGVTSLYEKGLERKPRLLSLQRIQAQIIGKKGENIAEIMSSREKISEAKLEVNQYEVNRRNEITSRLAELRMLISETEQTLLTNNDTLARTIVRAPVEGTITDVKFSTVGGVVSPGAEILDIVPTRERLVIDAKISPYDIDMVHAGASAQVILSAYPQRTTPNLSGVVDWISADVKLEKGGDQPFYASRIIIERDAISKLPENIKLYPGMPTEVMITAGERTALDYLLDPLLTSVRRSFIEG